jgi:hypothetical protein
MKARMRTREMRVHNDSRKDKRLEGKAFEASI